VKQCVEITGNDQDKIKAKPFYEHYLTWVEENEGPGAYKVGPKIFGQEMSTNFDKTTIKGVNHYLGLILKDIG